MKIVVTGSQGFIGGYLVEQLLSEGHVIVGVDNFSKYGRLNKTHDSHPNFSLVEMNLEDEKNFCDVLEGADHLVAGAAKIGGITYFHKFAYDLLAKNERILATTCDAAINAFQNGSLKKVTYISSSMVFENAQNFPSLEGDELKSPPPSSSYGFQKLSTEYFARAAWDQYQLPYTIVRPFNCIGIGEARAASDKYEKSGNISLAMSHVVPDLIQKIVKGQDPLHVLGTGSQIRHYTYGGDLARGISMAMQSDFAINEDFNLSTPVGHTVIELANVIFRKVTGSDINPIITMDEPYEYDVQMRIPSTEKAKDILGFQALTPLETALDEIIPWVRNAIDTGAI
jgi:nucleoside-diphosphate-sugar epimerase